MTMRIALGLAFAALAACGGAEDAATPAPAAQVSPAAMACAGERLPLTGACAEPDAALFVAMDTKRAPFAPECVWRTQELDLGEDGGGDTALLFRAQDCSAAGWDRLTYEWDPVERAASVVFPGGGDSIPPTRLSMVQVHAAPADGNVEDAASAMRVHAPDDQQAHCAPAALTATPAGLTIAGRAFELAPDAELRARMEAASPDEPWDACGPYGVTMSAVQFWEARKTRALFHTVGQDETYWDAASFTFYAKRDGEWVRDE